MISLAEVVDDNSAPGGSGQDAQFVFNVPAAGTYLILANLIGSPREGEYTLETSTM